MADRIIIHDAAQIAPPLEGEPFEAFCDVLKRYGPNVNLDPIMAVRVPEADGKVNGTLALLSGRTNFEACKKLGLKPKIDIYEGDEPPAELAASLNILRPHLTTSQRAAAGVQVEQQIAVEARKRQKTAGGDRKSLLVKLPKAIHGHLGGGSILANMLFLQRRPTVELRETFLAYYPDGATRSRYFDDQRLIEEILRAVFPAPQAPPDNDSERIHALERAAKICNVSPTYIGRAKVIFESNRDLFGDLVVGKIQLGPAFGQVKRDKKRKAIETAAASLPRVAVAGMEMGIRTGDCMKIMPTLPRRKFRLYFEDPQYNIGKDYGDGAKADKLKPSEYLAIAERRINMIPELLTPDGSAWVVINDEYAAEYCMMLKRAGLHQRGWIKWYETFGINCQNKFNRTSRHLHYFVRDPKRVVFNVEAFNRPSARQVLYNDGRAREGGKLWDDVWAIPRLVENDREHLAGFPTQLPLALVRPIVEGCTEPGDNVLDSHSGSGTTVVACAMTGRNGIGIEISGAFANMSRVRLDEALKGRGKS